MSALNIILWVFVLLFITLITTTIVIVAKNADAINYTFFNEIYCPGTTTCVLEPNDNLSLPNGEWDYSTYNNNIAKISLDLITRVVQENFDVPYEDFVLHATLSTSLDCKKFCCIWETETKNEIWLSFRGTDNVKEWATDAKVKQLNYEQASQKYKNAPFFMQNDNEIMLHAGFLSIFGEIADQIVTTIDTLNPSKDKTICVSGHSLGAAMATIFGLELYSLGYQQTCIYSFASPRIGNLKLKEYYEHLPENLPLFRIINTEDTIPQTPTTVSPNFKDAKNPFLYGHFGTVISFSKNAQSLSNNHSLFVYEQNLP